MLITPWEWIENWLSMLLKEKQVLWQCNRFIISAFSHLSLSWLIQTLCDNFLFGVKLLPLFPNRLKENKIWISGALISKTLDVYTRKQCSNEYISRNVIKVSVYLYDIFWKLNTTLSYYSEPTISVFLKRSKLMQIKSESYLIP